MDRYVRPFRNNFPRIAEKLIALTQLFALEHKFFLQDWVKNFHESNQKNNTYLKPLFLHSRASMAWLCFPPRRRASFAHFWLPHYARIQESCKHNFLQKSCAGMPHLKPFWIAFQKLLTYHRPYSSSTRLTCASTRAHHTSPLCLNVFPSNDII